MKKIIATAILAVAAATGAAAQGIYIYKTDGQRLGFNYSEIDRIEAYMEEDVPDVPMINDVEFFDDADIDGVMSAYITLTKGETVTISGIPGIDGKIQPAYFSGAGGVYTFNAADGRYKVMYSTEYDLVWAQYANDDWTKNYYPHCVWMCGPGAGHPGSAGKTPTAWAWDRPWFYTCLVGTGNNIFEADVYLEDGFQFRFYKGHGDWGNTFDAQGVDTIPEYWCGWAAPDVKSVNFGPGPDFTPGVYHLRLDLNTNILSFLKK